MNEIPLLIPKTKLIVSVLLALTADVTFSSTLGIGSILIAALVVIIAGVFTLRNNLKTFWKNLAEERGEAIKVLEERLRSSAAALVEAQTRHTAEIVELQHVHAEEMAGLVEAERTARHELKGRVAILEGQLVIEQSKHDLSIVVGELADVKDRLTAIDVAAVETAKAVATFQGHERLLLQIIETLDRKFTVTETEGSST